mmetsp:Transcript_9635/g.24020  ORF Transcript_9635/g.24020 Transcript_9635/m.24020 type:complete len:312 (+) Transcript_9635:81-1016(+)
MAANQAWYDEDPKDEQKIEEYEHEEKRASPWAEPHHFEDSGSRVVGWFNGKAITKAEQVSLLRTNKDLKRQYLDDRKAISGSKSKEWAEPLAGLPPTWQAFWSTVPDLDAQAAWKAERKDQQRKERQKRQEESAAHVAKSLPPRVDGESAEEERMRLVEEIGKKQKVLAEIQQQEIAKREKTKRSRAFDKREEAEFRNISRKCDKVSYEHGILQGKIRSSDTYFNFLLEDTKAMHKKKVITQNRAAALMGGQIDDMKGDVRQLLKVAAETLPPPPAEEGGSLTNPSGGSLKDVTTEEEASASEAERVTPAK